MPSITIYLQEDLYEFVKDFQFPSQFIQGIVRTAKEDVELKLKERQNRGTKE